MYNSISPFLSCLQDPRHRKLLLSLSSTGIVSFAILWWSAKKGLNSNTGYVARIKSYLSSIFKAKQSLATSRPSDELQAKVGVNSQFYSQLIKLAPILIPGM